MPRMLDRMGLFEQSEGRFNIYRSYGPWRSYLYMLDWYHTVIDLPTWRVMFLIFVMYGLSFFFFALVYFYAPQECRMPQESFTRSFFFSVDTMMTIGYGVEDSGFHDCWYALVSISSECVLGCIFDALCVGIVFERVGRSQKRAVSIVFSKQALIREVRGSLYLMFRVCEARKHQLCEAHVRMYAVVRRGECSRRVGTRARADAGPAGAPPPADHRGGPYTYFQTRPMRLCEPDDEMGACLLLATPSLVVHRIDAWSPLCPPELQRRGRPSSQAAGKLPSAKLPSARRGDAGPTAFCRRDPSRTYMFPEPVRRDDAAELRAPGASAVWPPRDAVARHVSEAQIEIICVLEGVEPATSGTVQARHSYIEREIVWDRMFAPCMVHDPRVRKFLVDFNGFHDTVPAPRGAATVYPGPGGAWERWVETEREGSAAENGAERAERSGDDERAGTFGTPGGPAAVRTA
jgi:potassium inwardly-rectifying channel subfamily J